MSRPSPSSTPEGYPDHTNSDNNPSAEDEVPAEHRHSPSSTPEGYHDDDGDYPKPENAVHAEESSSSTSTEGEVEGEIEEEAPQEYSQESVEEEREEDDKDDGPIDAEPQEPEDVMDEEDSLGEESETKEGGDMDEIKDDEEAPDDKDVISSSNENRQELTSYSTRGRAQEENALERLAAVGELLSISGHPRDMPAVLHSPETRMRESFLSDSLTEEERRTRTRYLPQVDGMHALRKHEVKGDLALARSTLSASGTTEKLVKASKRKHVDDDAAAMDMESAGLSGEDAIMSEEDRIAAGTKVIEIGSSELMLPSPAFVAPAPEPVGNAKRPSPREVEAVVAFNPPRPPESIGAKKKHRMLRWERRPADIEVDLSNYRKTVQRTREELNNAQDQCERIITVDNQLRRHFMQHIRCMNEELLHVGDELAAVQQECIDVADLPSSRTRTRGAVKGSTAMRDVLHTLRAKGKEIEAKGLVITGSSVEPSKVHGAGGVAATSFVDWDRSTVIEPSKFAQAWIVPGDKVQTPYGEGTVLAFYGPGALNTEETPHHQLVTKTPVGLPKEDAMEVVPSESPPQPTEAVPGKKSSKASTKTGASDNSESLVNVLAPRIAVRLPFGIAFFNLDSVMSKEDPSKYSDDQMAKRWTGIAETAAALGATVDVSAMANILPREAGGDSILENPLGMDGAHDDENERKETKRRLVPFGANLLPTAVGRGTLLHKANVAELDKEVDKAFFFKGDGVLGSPDNIGVPHGIKKLEEQRQEHLILQARVLQLRNQLYRQRRIRMLNERTYAASQERASRVESLVAEMRTDLKSLKGRLDLEIRDLGISEGLAENILKAYYMSLDSQHSGEASPPKRHRRMSRMNDDAMEEAEGVQDSEVADSVLDAEVDEPVTELLVASELATAEQ
jgi:hypothetical protein